MTKIIITILAIYLFYYAGNIIYDLYFKKDNSEKKEEIEEFILNEFAENNKDLCLRSNKSLKNINKSYSLF